ncbi:MAG: pyridoxal-phosphate dependent enzyme [bacterium]
MKTAYLCRQCRQAYPEVGFPYVCPNCGGIYEVHSINDLEFDHRTRNQPGIWQYRASFGLNSTAPITYLGEGNTPLIVGRLDRKQIAYKLEYLNPTGSFKDRGTAVMVSMMKDRGFNIAIEDSSGNAGASFAAYSIAFGINAHIYIPESTSGPKRRQIEAYGAHVIPVPGPRENATKIALLAVEQQGIVYASHAYQPFGLAGIATLAYELLEQLGKVPGTIIVPVGHGSLLLGLMLGFNALYQANKIPRMPVFVGVQPKACSPLWAKWCNQTYVPSEIETIAEGTKVKAPIRGDAILEMMAKDDLITTVTDSEIIAAKHQLAKQGMFVEPTSAMVQAALNNLHHKLVDPIVLILTGFGLKSNK